MRFSILTLFPEYFQSPLTSSLFGRACSSGLLNVDFVNLREFGDGRYRAVDDKPYGGGAGMVLMPQVLERALVKLLGDGAMVDSLESSVADYRKKACSPGQPHVVFLSPQGAKLTAKKARELAGCSHLVLICGHYEGVDERAIEAFAHEELSIGDYVLTGGEPAAVVVMDAVSRFVAGVVGESASVEGDTFENGADMAPGGLKYPMFTRPLEWRGRRVPEVLVSGHHGEIAKWRRSQSEVRTANARKRDSLVASQSSDAPDKRRLD